MRKKGKKRMMVCASMHLCVCVCVCVCMCVCVCVCVFVCEHAHIYVCEVESAVLAVRKKGRKRVTVCDGTWK